VREGLHKEERRERVYIRKRGERGKGEEEGRVREGQN